jgi:hypothetical protein
MDDPMVGLAEAIASLRKELLAAIGEGSGAPMRFRLAPIDVSLQVATTKDHHGNVGWKVLGLGAANSAATTQTLTLKLEPVWLEKDGSEAGDPLISSQVSAPQRFGPEPTPEGT